jgi:hypothetical protein
MEAQVRSPSRVHDQRHAGRVRGRGVAREVADGPDITGITEEHRARAGVPRQRVPDGCDGDAGG